MPVAASNMQMISGQEIVDTLAQIVSTRAEVIVTFRRANTWQSIRGKAADARGDTFIAVIPDSHDAGQYLRDNTDVGVSFTIGSRKFLFASTVQEQLVLPEENEVRYFAISLSVPDEVQRIERRRAVRGNIPPEEIVRASFWPGGVGNKPGKLDPSRPTWAGKVTDLSVGGFQVRTHAVATTFFETNDIVGVSLSFEAVGKAVPVNAAVCHCQLEGNGMALMGFQFIDLDSSPEGLLALQLIGEKVREYVDRT